MYILYHKKTVKHAVVKCISLVAGGSDKFLKIIFDIIISFLPYGEIDVTNQSRILDGRQNFSYKNNFLSYCGASEAAGTK